jgi:hypothetical protein
MNYVSEHTHTHTYAQLDFLDDGFVLHKKHMHLRAAGASGGDKITSAPH